MSGLAVISIGVAVVFVGFTAKWTDRTWGVAHVAFPAAFEWLGTWAIRVGFAITAIGAVLRLIGAI